MNASLTIRPTRSSDAEAVRGVLTASYGTLFAGWYEADLLSAILPLVTTPHDALLRSGTYFIVEDDTAAALAVGGWTREAPPARDTAGGAPDAQGFREADPSHGHIRHFATHPDHLRRGAARMILERCEREARTQGLATLVCRASLPGERFYAACGFVPVRRIETRLQNGLVMPSVLMRKPLAHPASPRTQGA